MNNVNAHLNTTVTYILNSWNMLWMWIQNQHLDITVLISSPCVQCKKLQFLPHELFTL